MWDALLNYLVEFEEPLDAHAVRAVLFVLWLPFLLVKLSLIDRRDLLTSLDYIGYGMASGVLLLWGLPAVLEVPLTSLSLAEHGMWLAAIVALTAWNYFRVKTDSFRLAQQRIGDGKK